MSSYFKLKDFLMKFDRSAFSVPLNYPLFYKLKNNPNNSVIRIIKGLWSNLFMKGYEIYTNERIVEVPFVFHALCIKSGVKVLDFGCSESMLSIELASMGYDVTGVDLSDYQLQHPNFRFVKGNFIEAKMQERHFDAVIAVSAVEHCGLSGAYGSEEIQDGDRKVMEEFYRVLKNDGLLILTVPFGKKGTMYGRFGQRVYDENSLSDLLRRFRVIRDEYFVGINRKHWLPASKKSLAEIDSASAGFTQGVACIVAEKVLE